MMRSLISNAKLTKLAGTPVVDSAARVESALVLSGSFATPLLLLSKQEGDLGRRFQNRLDFTDIPRRSFCIGGTRA